MSAPPAARLLFRAEALEHYRKRQHEVALPRFITGGYAGLLWLLALVLMAGTAGVVFALRGLFLSRS
ncbi:hypothetical protein [Corallococcus exercitus]|uniref:hypothetical protein n=1 Tax=Corallococcus exercitus TaxID=2316736 RepID=UPI001AC00010|nr:hypothetical protein [Corallococcus exercitus]